MKIAAITDIHARTGYPRDVIEQLQKADILLIAGDITNFGDREEAERIISELEVLNHKQLAIHGNCDRAGVVDVLRSRKMNLHATTRLVGNVMFFGIGGCNKTPFHTPTEYSEEEIHDTLNRFKKIPGASRYVLVSHAPPHNTKLDKVFLGLHVGSKIIRNFIVDFQPDIVICGHIHESKGTDHLGKTLIINPGPFPKHYALIEIDGAINYELH
jgi:Icc-related predicted phosphoesterase